MICRSVLIKLTGIGELVRLVLHASLYLLLLSSFWVQFFSFSLTMHRTEWKTGEFYCIYLYIVSTLIYLVFLCCENIWQKFKLWRHAMKKGKNDKGKWRFRIEGAEFNKLSSRSSTWNFCFLWLIEHNHLLSSASFKWLSMLHQGFHLIIDYFKHFHQDRRFFARLLFNFERAMTKLVRFNFDMLERIYHALIFLIAFMVNHFCRFSLWDCLD